MDSSWNNYDFEPVCSDSCVCSFFKFIHKGISFYFYCSCNNNLLHTVCRIQHWLFCQENLHKTNGIVWDLFENIPSWTDNYLTIKILPVSCDFLSRRESFSRFSLFLLLKRHPWRSRTRNKLASLHTQSGKETIFPSCECFRQSLPSFPYFYKTLDCCL